MRIEDAIIDLGDHQLLLRNAGEEDAEMLLECLKTTCGETRFLVKEPEEIDLTLDDERKFIHNQNESKQNIMLLGFVDGEYVGNCSLMGDGTGQISPSRQPGDRAVSKVYRLRHWKGDDREAD